MWIESRCQHDTVQFMQTPIRRAYPACLDMTDLPNYELGIRLRHDPLRRALKQRNLFHFIDDGRQNLGGSRPRANDPDALAFQGHAVIPARGMKRRTLKLL